MKKSVFIGVIILLLLTAVPFSGCKRVLIGEENGTVTTRQYGFTDFNSIEIGYAFKLEVTPSDTYSIEITARESTFDHIKVTQNGSKLEIGMDRLFFHLSPSPRVKITMPELRGLHMSGASDGIVTGFKSSQDLDLTLSGASELDIEMETGTLKCEISGASELKMDMKTANFLCELSGASDAAGYLKATSCDVELSGASEIELTGSGGNIRIDATGSSEVKLIEFAVNDAGISLSGGSYASLNVNGIMDVNLSGASTVEYTGNPTLGEFSLTGGSELERK